MEGIRIGKNMPKQYLRDLDTSWLLKANNHEDINPWYSVEDSVVAWKLKEIGSVDA